MIEEMVGDFLQKLRGFFFVAKTSSFSKAALEMGRNQPAITHQIKCLENEFGVRLFDRSKGGMKLTPEGEKILEKTISIFELIKEMKGEINESHLQLEGKIVIATTYSIIQLFLPPYIINFRSKHPRVIFEIEGGTLRTVLDKVESAEADLGIIGLINSVPNKFVFYELFETSLTLIAPKNNSFFTKKEPTLKQISKVPYISFSSSATITPLIERTFAESGLELNVVLVLNNFQMIKKYVSSGIGVSILYDYMVTEEDRREFDIFSLDYFFDKRKWGLIVRKRKYFSPTVKEFIHSIKPDIHLK